MCNQTAVLQHAYLLLTESRESQPVFSESKVVGNELCLILGGRAFSPIDLVVGNAIVRHPMFWGHIYL